MLSFFEYILFRILSAFGYFLLIWKSFAAVGLSIAGPIFMQIRHRQHPEEVNDWLTIKIIVFINLTGALSGYLIIKKHMAAATAFLFIGGSILYAHYLCIQKGQVLGLLVAYWRLLFYVQFYGGCAIQRI